MDDHGKGSAESDDETVAPDGGAVEVIHDQLKEWLAEDRERAHTLSQRAAWMLGFSGVILGLGASQADQVLSSARELGPVGRAIAAGALGFAFLAVVVAAFFSLSVLVKRRRAEIAIDEEEVRNALAPEYRTQTKAWNQLRFAQVYQQQIPQLRRNNRERAVDLTRALVALVVAVVLLLLHSGVFLERTIEAPSCAATTTPALTSRSETSPATDPGRLRMLAVQRSSPAQTPAPEVQDLPDCPKTTTVPG